MRIRSIAPLLACIVLAAGCGDDLGTDATGSMVARGGETLGEDLIVAAVGLDTQPARLEFTVPVASGADIIDARLRWVGRGTIPTGDNAVTVNGHQRLGTLLATHDVGGEAPWLTIHEYDATSLIRHGFNRLYVSGFVPGGEGRADGIAIVVRYRDDSSPWTAIHVLDPLEYVNASRGQVWQFPIGFSRDPRNARFVMLAGDCETTLTDRVWWSVGPGAAPLDLADAGSDSWTDRLEASEGSWIDRLDEPVEVPSMASHFAYQLESPADGTGDSIAHVFSALCIDGRGTDCFATVSGLVFLDEDRDGQNDADEPGIAGVLVRLRSGADESADEVLTDETGTFSFGGLCAGDYVLAIDEATLPDGLQPTTCASSGCSPSPVSVTADDQSVSDFAFGWAASIPPPETACFYGPGFWKHELRVLTGPERGCRCQHLEPDVLMAVLRDAAASTSLDWTRGDGTFDPVDALWLLECGDRTTCERAERHFLVCLLNHSLNGGHPDLPVDTDENGEVDSTIGEVISAVESLLTTGSESDCEAAKRLASSAEPIPSEDCGF